MAETLESAQKGKEQLEHWRNCLNNWITWMDAEIAAISNGNPPNKILSLLLQHIALITPWFRGLMNALPAKAPDNIPVTRLPYQESSEHRLNLWGQCVSHRESFKGVLNRETDTV